MNAARFGCSDSASKTSNEIVPPAIAGFAAYQASTLIGSTVFFGEYSAK